jgi:hypothetical protein
VVQVSTVTETAEACLVPIGEVEVTTESSWREREMRIASHELVRVPPHCISTLTRNRRECVAHCMSTALPSKPHYDHHHNYHLGVHHRLRQRIRCASQGLDGYESSSKSGSSGLSEDSNHKSSDHASRLGPPSTSRGDPGSGFLDEAGAVGAFGDGGGRGVVVPVPPYLC